MGALQDLVDFLGLGPRNWKQRLKGKIDFVSPDGNEFSAYWRGSPRSLEKKLGIFDYPKVKGTIVQDMDVRSNRYPITFFFEGENNDKDANNFFAACKENGQWVVTHPVHGFLGLTLISITEVDNPTESGNITEFNSEWIEDIDPTTLKTAREMAGIIDGKSTDLNANALEQFVDAVNTTTTAITDAIKTATQAIENASAIALSPIAAINDSIWNIQNAIQDGIQDTLNATVLDTTALAGQIQALIEYPALSIDDINARLDAYETFIDEIFESLPGRPKSNLKLWTTDLEARNQILTHELALTASMIGIANTVVTGPLTTKAEVIDIGNKIIQLTENIGSTLDGYQEEYQQVTIDGQYFSQSDTYAQASSLMSDALRYLLISSFDLKIEKRFILERPRAPIEICITEYGDLGENDSNLDLFIDSNNLYGKDILLLPAGKEILIYA